MYELISHPGLQFYIFRLYGTLTYTLTVAGRPPRKFELHEVDFEDAEGFVKDEEVEGIQGIDASAVGLKLTLVKNVGHLEMSFTGTDGGSASWIFEGLKELGRAGVMYATAGIQTSASVMVDGEMQTEAAASTSSSTQTEPTPSENDAIDVESSIPTNPQAAMVDASTMTQITVPESANTSPNPSGAQPEKKRKWSTISSTPIPASTETITSPPTPLSSPNTRYLFLWGYKRFPLQSKNYGALRIDTQAHQVIWQERSGDYPWKWEKWECNIDLREPKRKIKPQSFFVRPPFY